MTEMPPYLAVKDEEKNSGQCDSDSSSDVDDWDLPLSFDKPRHLEPIKGAERVEHSWRVKEKYKTHCVALVLCLNVGVDPPDVVKTQPCARLECWTDPQSMSQSKALETIGHCLQTQYERWQPRARYKQSLDPTSDEVKKLCCSLRRNAKDERVLFHYNGHGVPKPTAQGEIWVFNRSYTQYIPLSMYDLQTWMGAPSLYVYDCSNAGVIVDNFKQFADQHEREYEAQASSKSEPASPPVSYKNCIQLAACASGQALPMNPELPADLFTACLTTPVKMAMKWFVLRTRTRIAPPNVHDLIDKIPGQVTDRRTMLGELNWIFTAITDTIAWSSLPPELFQQLFRADLLTASLCRNFLLADRIMRSYNCTPVSAPALPSLAAHPLWAAWEHTLDAALAQLPALLAERADYRHSPFFRDQLTAFQVWLELGAPARGPPAQLPMVLQVLLSTLHRVRALQLLCRYLALGAAAVRAVLAVGIFPYMLKLLQASAPNLRASMVYIWARIVAVDPSCQADLVNAKGHKYFLSVLQDPSVDSEHRTLAAYVLAGIVDNYPPGQEAALQGSMISICLEQLNEGNALLAQWACIALGRLWRGFDAARWAGVRDLAHEKLYPLMQHAQPEVRAACAFALGAFVAAGGARSEHANALDHQVGAQLARCLPADASALVRAEALAALQWLVLIFEQTFIAVYIQERARRSGSVPCSREGQGGGRVDPGQDALAPAPPAPRAAPPAARPAPALALPAIGFGSVYMKLWGVLCAMAREPHPQVSQMANDIIGYIANQVDSVGRAPEPHGGSGSGSSSLPPSPNAAPSPLADLPRHHALGNCRLRGPGPASDRPRTGERFSSDERNAQRGPASSRPLDRVVGHPGGSNEMKGNTCSVSGCCWTMVLLVPGSLDTGNPSSGFMSPARQVRLAAHDIGGVGGGAGPRAGLHLLQLRSPRQEGDSSHRVRRVGGRAAGARPVRRPGRRGPRAPRARLAPGAEPRAARRGRTAAHDAGAPPGDAGVPGALPAARRRGGVPPVRAARRRGVQGQLRRVGVGQRRQGVRRRVAARLGPHHVAGVRGRARGRPAGGRLALRPRGRLPRARGARAAGRLARARRAPRARLPPAARPAHIHGRRRAAGHAAGVERAAPVAGRGGRGRLRAAVGRARRAAGGGRGHRHGGARHGAGARAPRAGRRLRGRRRARLGRARAAPALRAAAARAPAGRARAPRPARARLRRGGRRGARVRHAPAAAHVVGARAGPAGRRRRAPARQPARLRLGEPVDQHLRPEGRAPQHDQVPRGVHGRAHRARLLPRLPSAQVCAGRGVEGRVGVGVRGGAAPVTLALQPRALPLAASRPTLVPISRCA